ncbi:YggT family protein [Virgibacillus soli]|uniref:YggT family protein n=1 Tax=Paracerasibacillus soli TaxID=480284 RepID=A0ABU5CRP8_9BACI|nr:YggT family protein [Virgibacillus soli]MDY0408113.1 YggT family protein [Virgibacillus soli]
MVAYEIFKVINTLISIYSFGIIIYIFMSWFPGARESTFGEFLGRICEPYLEQFRRFIPPLGMIDFSPIIAIICLRLASTGLWSIFQFFFM